MSGALGRPGPEDRDRTPPAASVVSLPGPAPAAVLAVLERELTTGDDVPAVLWGRWTAPGPGPGPVPDPGDVPAPGPVPDPGADGAAEPMPGPAAEPDLLVFHRATRTVRGLSAVLEVLDGEPAVAVGPPPPDGRIEAPDRQTAAPGGPTPVPEDGARQPSVGGGWVVCLGYDPDTVWARHYDQVLRRDPAGGWFLEVLPDAADRFGSLDERVDAARRLLTAAAAVETADPYAMGECAAGPDDTRVAAADPGPARRADATREHYLAAVEQAIGRVDHGAFYQVNLCTRLHADFRGSSAGLTGDLMTALAPKYGAWLPDPDAGRDVVSCSPELFLRIDGDRITAAPIKGTVRREPGRDTAAELRASAKDAAENVMITDLMRNDLSRVCRTGSVRVTKLLDLEAHPGVWHLVSTVEGRLTDGSSIGAILRAGFPPGSVTGAPKSSAVTGITQLEAEPRGAYTGAAGLISPYAGTTLGVLIRTFEIERPAPGAPGHIALGVGAGITVDSVPVREWQECLDKAAPLVAAAGSRLDPVLVGGPPERPDRWTDGVFETVLVLDGTAVRSAGHLARLDRSVRELFGAGLPEALPARVRAAAAPLSGRHALTIHAAPQPADPGEPGRRPALRIELATRPLGARLAACRLVHRPRPAVVWRHKWRDRSALQQAEASSSPDLPWFTDAAGRVAETSRGNLFARDAAGIWVTPPLEEEVLPGVTRRETLDLLTDLGVPVRIASLAPADLTAGRPVFWTSSLSGAVAVSSVDGVASPPDETLLAELNARLGAPASGRRR